MRSVIYIERSSIYYYGGNTKTPLSIQITPTALADNELINPEEMTKQLQNFFTAGKIAPNSIVIFFSSKSCFQKIIPGNLKPDEILRLKNDFIDQVPFNHVLDKTYTSKNNSQVVVAVNKDLAYFLRNLLIKFQFQVEAIVPAFALFGDQQGGFNTNTAQEILKHFSLLQKVSFPIYEKDIQKEPEFSEPKEGDEKKESSSRLYMMIAVFAVLIVILIIVFAISRKPKTTTSNTSITKKTTATIPVKKVAIVSNTETPSPTQEPVAKNSLNIRILNGSGIAGQADTLRAELESEDYSNIEVGNVPTQSAEKSLIVVKPTVPVSYRENIQAILSANNVDSIVRINAEIDVDVLITTYQIGG